MASRKEMTLWLNPEDAGTRQITDGMPVMAFNELGEVQFTARVDDRVAAGNAVSEGFLPAIRRRTAAGLIH